MADGPERRSGGLSPTMRWARRAAIIGAVLLSAAVAVFVWEASGDDPPPVVITGQN